ncbi:MAG: C40 family peptidase [Bacteroidales bacterium]|jgi:cell wall-associated NlpC family hydrolase|nr:C40 family peptidase [Bacteroidales bacterium]
MNTLKRMAAGIFLSCWGLAATGQHRAIVEYSANFMREQPDYTAELGNQALMGTVVELLDTVGYWIKIRTPEPYTAWVTASGLVPMTEAGIQEYLAAPKYICTAILTHVYAAPSRSSEIVSELVAGDLVRILYKIITHTRGSLKGYEEGRAVLRKKFVGVALPSGKTGYVAAEDVDIFFRWAKERRETAINPAKTRLLQDRLKETAERFLGVPYLWGGTSVKNVDCSGLTRSVFFLNGILLPRNASQQAKVGEDIPLFTADRQVTATALCPGDLLFWGREATDSAAEKVTHVGIYLGNYRFIHSSQVVRFGSLDPTAPDYYDRKPIRARRILGHVDEPGSGIVSVLASPDYFSKEE